MERVERGHECRPPICCTFLWLRRMDQAERAEHSARREVQSIFAALSRRERTPEDPRPVRVAWLNIGWFPPELEAG